MSGSYDEVISCNRLSSCIVFVPPKSPVTAFILGCPAISTVDRKS